MSKDPAFPFYAQDFLTGVMHLTMDERGIYITLLAYQWAHGQIPIKRVGLILGLSWDSISSELKDKFKGDGDFILNERLELEREKRKNFKEKQRLNGQKGGRPKNPNKTQTVTQKNPLEDESEKENEIVIEEVKEEETNIYPTFNDFWNLYDKKSGKKKAEPKWETLKQSEKELIMVFIPNYKLSQPDKKFRKDPVTFLNNESWNDEIIFSQNINQNGKQEQLGELTTAIRKQHPNL